MHNCGPRAPGQLTLDQVNFIDPPNFIDPLYFIDCTPKLDFERVLMVFEEFLSLPQRRMGRPRTLESE